MPKLAANLSMLWTEHDFLDRFEAAAKAGFKGVEFLFPYAYPANALAERLERNGLVQVLFNMPPGNWDGGERGLACLAERKQEFQDGVGRAIEYAKALKCSTLHCMAGLAPDGADPERLRATYVENVRFAAAETKKAGIKLVLEPINTRDIPRYYLSTPRQGFQMLDAVGSDNVLLQYDIYHAQVMQGDLARTIEENLARIGHMQLADNPGRNEPGTGEINWDFLLAQIDRVGYAGWIGCEYKPKAGTDAGLGWAKKYLGR
jgi:hydroxypyruvate isomerase